MLICNRTNCLHPLIRFGLKIRRSKDGFYDMAKHCVVFINLSIKVNSQVTENLSKNILFIENDLAEGGVFRQVFMKGCLISEIFI
jgi:hypothetical protein